MRRWNCSRKMRSFPDGTSWRGRVAEWRGMVLGGWFFNGRLCVFGCFFCVLSVGLGGFQVDMSWGR